MNTEEVLSQIDDALEDWSVGPDAMRCGAAEPSGPLGILTSTDLQRWMDDPWDPPTLAEIMRPLLAAGSPPSRPIYVGTTPQRQRDRFTLGRAQADGRAYLEWVDPQG